MCLQMLSVHPHHPHTVYYLYKDIIGTTFKNIHTKKLAVEVHHHCYIFLLYFCLFLLFCIKQNAKIGGERQKGVIAWRRIGEYQSL